MQKPIDVIIIGGGAAGLMAAIWALRKKEKVLVLESKNECAKKILISGGGRCNILPSIANLDYFYSESKSHSVKKVFKTWPLEQIQMFFEYELNLPLKVEADTGKLYPSSNKSRDVRNALVREVKNLGGDIRHECKVESLAKKETLFNVLHTQGEHQAPKVILATGGLSVPQTGSEGAGYKFAKTFGHSCLQTYPALVPLLSDDQDFKDLSGLSHYVSWKAKIKGKVVDSGERNILFTHKGFSGPAILDASHWVIYKKADLILNFCNTSKEDLKMDFISTPSQNISKWMRQYMPNRLAKCLLKKAVIPHDVRLGNINKESREKILEAICNYKIDITGSRGFQVAEVTGGGVPLAEINLNTFESKKIEGLYLCGELLDIFGRIGGHNFYWAFVSGKLAGEH